MAGNFTADDTLRNSAKKVGDKLITYLHRAGAAARQTPTHPQHSVTVDRREKAYGETHYALDELNHLAGGPEPTPRDAYFFALETDP